MLKNDVPEALVNDWSCQLVIAQLLSKGSFPIIVAGRYHNKLDEIAEIATTFDHKQNFLLLQSKLNSLPLQKYDTIPNGITYDAYLQPFRNFYDVKSKS